MRDLSLWPNLFGQTMNCLSIGFWWYVAYKLIQRGTWWSVAGAVPCAAMGLLFTFVEIAIWTVQP